MRVEELIVYGKKYLNSTAAKMLLSNILGYDSLDLLNHLDEIIGEENIIKYKKCIDAVLNNKPLQYIIGRVNFYGNEFIVNENVLIPRFETEELVEHTIRFVEEHFLNKNLSVIDLGCGSGVIGITLKKKLPTLSVTCLDISEKALEVTRENAKSLGADINIVLGDMLNNINDKFDIIISNPPYIKLDEEVEAIVKDNEPYLALFADQDGLKYYRQILEKVKDNLKEKFLIAFEIGMTQKDDITNIANEYLENIEIKCLKDLSNKDRMLFIYRV